MISDGRKNLFEFVVVVLPLSLSLFLSLSLSLSLTLSLSISLSYILTLWPLYSVPLKSISLSCSLFWLLSYILYWHVGFLAVSSLFSVVSPRLHHKPVWRPVVAWQYNIITNTQSIVPWQYNLSEGKAVTVRHIYYLDFP